MTEQRKITYIGWVGYNNLGDEALYQSNQKIFEPYQLTPDGKLHSKITLLGGGTLLPCWIPSIIPNRYVYAFGVGVRNPSFWGEFNQSLIKRMKKFNFRYISVRGNTSRALLTNWGIKSEVVGDPTLLLEPNQHQKREYTKIAVNVGSDGLVWGGDEERVLREIAKLCKTLKKDGYCPILIPFWENNVPYVKRICKTANIAFFKNWTNIQEVLDLIASCHILIGERLHSIIFASIAYTPFISLEYRPKCLDFAETMGFKKYNIRIDEITAEKVTTMFHDLSEKWTHMHRQLLKNVKIYRTRLRKAATLIKKDIESLPDNKWSPNQLTNITWTLQKIRRKIRREKCTHKMKTYDRFT